MYTCGVSDLRDELDEALLDDGTDPEGDPDTWRQEDAEYLLRTIAWARRQARNHEKMAQAELYLLEERRLQISARLDEIIAPYRKRWESAEARLDDWTRAQARRDSRRKSWTLLNGEVRLRAGAPSIKVDDAELLVKHLQDEGHGDLVETVTTSRPKAGEIKKLARTVMMSEAEADGSNPEVDMFFVLLDDGTGAYLPGVHIEKPRDDKFSYDIAP